MNSKSSFRALLVLCSMLPPLVIGAGSLSEQPAAGNANRPNFIFFITDDISPQDISPYGNKVIHTPNLDRIALGGLVFDQAYNVISSCSPIRSSIITGRYPHNDGAPELFCRLPANQRTFVQELKRAGYFTVISGKNDMAEPMQLGFDTSSDSQPGGEANWIRHLRERPKDRPFFCWFASHDAHYPFDINDKAPTYRPEDINVPPMMFDGPLTREEIAKYYHEVSRSDYYAGELMKELKSQGALDNTYFIYCSDNGRPFPRCKTYLFDSGTQTPLIISGPQVKTGRTSSLVSSIDYAPTILELAGLRAPETVQGVSFVSILRNPVEQVRNVIFAERNWHVFAVHERMVRTADWLYIWNAWPNQYDVCGESSVFDFPAAKELWDMAGKGRLTDAQKIPTFSNQPPEMLFQVTRDPFQFSNLAGHAEYTAALQKMRGLLDDWKAQTGDNVPKNPTHDRDSLHEAKKEMQRRGDFPGAANHATKINLPGPVKINLAP